MRLSKVLLVALGLQAFAVGAWASSGILVYFSDRSILPKAQEHFKKNGWRLAVRSLHSPLEHWVPTEIAMDSKSDAICKELKNRYSSRQVICEPNVPLKFPVDLGAHGIVRTHEAPLNGPATGACRALETLNGEDSVRTHAQGKLSVYWAQEYAGLDIAKTLYQEIRQTTSSIQATRTAVMDGAWDDHGGRVVGVVKNSAHHLAVTPADKKSKELNFYALDWDSVIPANSDSEESLFARQKLAHNSSILLGLNHFSTGADVVNLSVANISETSYRSFEDYIAKHNSLFVIGANNDAEMEVDHDPLKDQFKSAIMVGSVGTSGFMSDFSSPFGNVTISAPSDNFLSSTHPGNFAGTSGAAPLVTAAMAQVKSVLPALNVDQAKAMLRATALPTPNMFYKPARHGHGTLNAYGLLALARTLRRDCMDAVTNQINTRCFKAATEAAATKTAPKGAEELLRVSRHVFGCDSAATSPTMSSEASCQQKTATLKQLREAAYIHPHYGPAWGVLACAHSALGFKGNARFYQTLSDLNPWPPPQAGDQLKQLRRRAFGSEHPIPIINNIDYLDAKEEDFKRGFSRTNARQHADLVEVLRRTVLAGNGEAIRGLGESFGTSSDEVQVDLALLLQEAAKNGHTSAITALGRGLELADETVRPQVVSLLRELASEGSVEAAELIEKVLGSQ